MMFTTHILIGIMSSFIFIRIFNPSHILLSMILVIFASILPDIDTPMSKLGKKVKFISFIFKHRGFFHSFLAIIIFAFILNDLIRTEYTLAFVWGYLSHIISDGFTISGVRLFHPFSKKSIKGFIKTGSIFEYLFLGLIIIFFLLTIH